jgi:hypothetical protein
MFNFEKIKEMKIIRYVFVLCIIGVCIMITGGCKKVTNAPVLPTPVVTCMIDTIAFTATSLSVGNVQGYNTIKAINTSATGIKEINIQFSSNATGTYPLNMYNASNSFGAAYFTGTSQTELSGFATTGNSPFVGTCTITSSSNNTISGTFSFKGNDGVNFHTITNGVFTNVVM